MLYGHGGSDFLGSTQPFIPGTTSRLQVEVALHEVSHTLGAVQMSSPNSSGAGHCNDQYDVMCYDDGGPGSLFVDPNCDGDISAPPDSYSEDSQAWDCNKDDSSTSPPRAAATSPTTGTWPSRASSAQSAPARRRTRSAPTPSSRSNRLPPAR